MGKTYKDLRKEDWKKKRFMKNRTEDEYPEFMEYG